MSKLFDEGNDIINLPRYVKPERKTKHLGLLVPSSVWEKISTMAEKQGRSKNDLVVAILKHYLKC